MAEIIVGVCIDRTLCGKVLDYGIFIEKILEGELDLSSYGGVSDGYLIEDAVEELVRFGELPVEDNFKLRLQLGSEYQPKTCSHEKFCKVLEIIEESSQ